MSAGAACALGMLATTCIDRTAEFKACVNIFAGDQSAGHAVRRPAVFFKEKSIDRNSFYGQARFISRKISKCSGLLDQLRQKVKNVGVFADPSEEVNNLVARLSSDLESLKSSVKAIVAAKEVGNTHSSQAHRSKITGDLTKRLNSLLKTFQGQLELRSKLLKKRLDRRRQFSQGPLVELAPTLAGTSSAGTSYQQRSRADPFAAQRRIPGGRSSRSTVAIAPTPGVQEPGLRKRASNLAAPGTYGAYGAASGAGATTYGSQNPYASASNLVGMNHMTDVSSSPSLSHETQYAPKDTSKRLQESKHVSKAIAAIAQMMGKFGQLVEAQGEEHLPTIEADIFEA